MKSNWPLIDRAPSRGVCDLPYPDMLEPSLMDGRQRFVLLDDPYNDPDAGDRVEFHLRYEGPLKSTQRDPKPGSAQLSKHFRLKHEMRLDFHKQLKNAWKHHKLLVLKQDDPDSMLNAKNLAAAFKLLPWSFVPLVTPKIQVFCGIELVLLRLDHPGESGWSGDIDNRVKTLIDALTVPGANDGYGTEIPLDRKFNPLYVLMSEDKLLTKLSVETGRLLTEPPAGADKSYAHLSIRVTIRPENVTTLKVLGRKDGSHG